MSTQKKGKGGLINLYVLSALLILHFAPIYPAIRKLVVIEAAGKMTGEKTRSALLNLIFVPFFGLYVLLFKKWPNN